MSDQLIYDFVIDPDYLFSHVGDKNLVGMLGNAIVSKPNFSLVAFPNAKFLRRKLAMARERPENQGLSVKFKELMDVLGLGPDTKKGLKFRYTLHEDGVTFDKYFDLEDRNLAFHAVLSDTENLPTGERRLGLDEPYSPLIHEQSLATGVSRDAEVVARLLARAYLYSEKLTLVDPYFNPERTARLRFLEEQLEAVVAHRSPEKPLKEFKIHTGFRLAFYGLEGETTYEAFRESALRNLAPIIPTGLDLEIFFWEATHKARFHNRYILTEHYGIHMGDSQEHNPGKSDDDISLMTSDRHDEIWWRFRGDNPDPVYKKTHDPVVVRGTKSLESFRQVGPSPNKDTAVACS